MKRATFDSKAFDAAFGEPTPSSDDGGFAALADFTIKGDAGDRWDPDNQSSRVMFVTGGHPATKSADGPCIRCKHNEPNQYALTHAATGTYACKFCGMIYSYTCLGTKAERQAYATLRFQEFDREDMMRAVRRQGIDWVLIQLREEGYIQ